MIRVHFSPEDLAEIRVLIERAPEPACSDCEVGLTQEAG